MNDSGNEPIDTHDAVDEVVELSRLLNSPPLKVFQHFTDPDRYATWMGAGVTLEPSVGGVYRVEMGDGSVMAGTFLEIDPPHRVAFSWGWAPGAGESVLSGSHPDDLLPPGSSRVEVTFDEEGDGTRLALRHRDLPTAKLRADHRFAWNLYLDRLDLLLAGGDPGPDPHLEQRTAASIQHRLEIAAPREAVFHALTSADGIASWWTTGVSAEPASLGARLDVHFRGEFNPRLRITALAEPAHVAWEGISGHAAWGGTVRISFDLGAAGDGTALRFNHDDGGELSDDRRASINFNWGYYLNSLRLSCETGRGKPYRPDHAGARVAADDLS